MSNKESLNLSEEWDGYPSTSKVIASIRSILSSIDLKYPSS